MDGEGVGRGAWEPRAGRMKGRGMDRSSLKRKLAVLAVLTGVALIAAGCSKSSTPSTTDSSSASGTSAAPATLNVELDWVPNPDHVGIYYAQSKGYFTDAGLTVDFHPPSNAADPIKLVGLNKVDLAISYQPEMFYGQQNGLPVTAVATVVPVPLNSL